MEIGEGKAAAAERAAAEGTTGEEEHRDGTALAKAAVAL
jgi:hypothetical protein